MRRYFCPTCNNEVHFDNTVCVKCDNALGYTGVDDAMLSVPAMADWPSRGLRACANHDLIGCNWLVNGSDPIPFCISCRHTVVIPDLALERNIEHWARLERAKRALFYALLKLHLALPSREMAPDGWLRFEFKADEFLRSDQQRTVMTGHDAGLITINIAEADDAVRERHRVAMGEPYRTLLGHFRHEIGHFYWDQLVRDQRRSDSFRDLFGDERADYATALQQHYQSGPPLGWEQFHVSSYASAHPWEDFAETWAHYFHIIDGLETAQAYGIGQTASSSINPYNSTDCRELIADWIPLTITMNAMNRSMGNRDFYPFVMSETIATKLQYVHSLIHQ